jgi:hypothetical protein
MKTKNRMTSSESICLRRSGLAFCPRCGKAVELLSFEEAAESFNTDKQDIEILAKRGDLHRLHNQRANVMICSISLFAFFENRRTRLLDSHFTAAMSAGYSGYTS